MEKKTVLIVGSLGMLGQELVRVFSSDENFVVTAWDKEDLDITNFPLLKEKIQVLKPAILINAVAYNAVDRCETDEEEFKKALLLNRDVPGCLAELSATLGFLLVHYSTDYVFDGALEKNKKETGCCGGGCCGARSGQIGYNEEALPNPISRYGESKYAGERVVREKATNYYLIRLSKLFGKVAQGPEAKKSFFAVMLEQGAEKSEVQVVDDEKSCFTYAPDLALATKELVLSESAFDTYHLVNDGAATWYEAVLDLYRLAGKDTKVVPVAGDTFPRAAKRPSCSVLLNTKRPKMRHYTAALKEFLAV